jgi:hypothetical protein
MAQTKDLVLLKLYNLKMENKDRPDWADVSIENVKLKKYWSQWDRIPYCTVVNPFNYVRFVIHPIKSVLCSRHSSVYSKVS